MNRTWLAAFSLVALILILALASGVTLAAGGHQEGYPPPSLPTPTLATSGEVPDNPMAEPYPSGGTDFSGQAPVPIGIESGAASGESIVANTSLNTVAGDEPAISRGIVFLWLGFVAALLVFLTSVFGSIVLFTRRNES